jgi:DNA mismatch repair protein MutL
VFGREFAAELREIDYASPAVRITGFTGVPSSVRSSRGEQFVFVNNRPATAPVVQYAIREAFPGADTGNRPPIVLFIEVDCGAVDVNVHPAKREVRFINAGGIRDAIISAIRSALSPARSAPPPAAPSSSPLPPVSPELPPPSCPPKREETFDAEFGEIELRCFPQRPVPQVAPDDIAAPVGEGLKLFDDEATSGAPWKWAKAVGVVAGKYLLVETDSGFATVEIRAARERVLCERMLQNSDSSKPSSQKLLIPETVRLSPPAASRLRRYMDAMAGIGFQIEDFGDDHFKVDALPAALAESGIGCRDLLLGIAEDIENGGVRRGGNRWREEAVARCICGTIPKKTVLRIEDAQRLIDELAASEMPYISPRGKPTMVFTSFNELERRFGN